MRRSLWESTLAEFRAELGGTAPAPAGVSVAAATAAFSLSLLVKTLEIAAKREGASRHPEWIEEALGLSARLAELADEDAAAFDEFLRSLRLPKGSGAEKLARSDAVARATRATIEIPIEAAHCAATGIALCEQAAGAVHAFVAPDLEAAAMLLTGAVRAILGSVAYNLKQVSLEDPYFLEADKRCLTIEGDALRRSEALSARLAGQPKPL